MLLALLYENLCSLKRTLLLFIDPLAANLVAARLVANSNKAQACAGLENVIPHLQLLHAS